jgi:hypothetical protein
VALQAAFALSAENRQPFYQERVRWAAHHLARDERTVRRRIDEGIEQLAELAVSVVRAIPRPRSSTPWHTAKLRVYVMLDQPEPESLEFRQIVADVDGLRELDLALTLTEPPAPGRTASAEGLKIDVLSGGTLIRRRMESTDRYGFVLALPTPLEHGQPHDIAVRFRVPEGHPMQPHYVCLPKSPCDFLDLRVRFDLGRPPKSVSRLSDVFQRDVSDPAAGGAGLDIDNAGDLHVEFTGLTPGLAYGVRWEDGPIGREATG